MRVVGRNGVSKAMNAKLRWIIALAAIVVITVGFQFYQSSMKRRGGLALLHFQTVSDRVLAETRVLVSEATQSPSRWVVVAGSGTSQSMDQAESHMQWEICAQKEGLTTEDLAQLTHDAQAKLMQIIDFQGYSGNLVGRSRLQRGKEG